jgi:hypothetical protein
MSLLVSLARAVFIELTVLQMRCIFGGSGSQQLWKVP